MLVSLSRDARTAAAIWSQGAFVVHFVEAAQERLAYRFASRLADKFAGVSHHRSESGAPILEEFSRYLECDLAAEYAVGDHFVFVGDATRVTMQADPAEAVAWFDRGFSRLLPAQDRVEHVDGGGQFSLWLFNAGLAEPVARPTSIDVLQPG